MYWLVPVFSLELFLIAFLLKSRVWRLPFNRQLRISSQILKTCDRQISFQIYLFFLFLVLIRLLFVIIVIIFSVIRLLRHQNYWLAWVLIYLNSCGFFVLLLLFCKLFSMFLKFLFKNQTNEDSEKEDGTATIEHPIQPLACFRHRCYSSRAFTACIASGVIPSTVTTTTIIRIIAGKSL